MSQQLDTLTHAPKITDPNPTLITSHEAVPATTNDREEVKAMAIFERQPRARAASNSRARAVPNSRARAWDELSEIDRAVLLETVRLRRKAREQRSKLHRELYGMRINL